MALDEMKRLRQADLQRIKLLEGQVAKFRDDLTSTTSGGGGVDSKGTGRENGSMWKGNTTGVV